VIKHVVMWKLKPEADGLTKAQNAEKLRSLLLACKDTTPGMLAYEVGFDIGTDSAPWDVILYSEFESRAALEAYQTSPVHLALKSQVGNMRESRAAVDYEV
jgi:quinol monooxygenase YgiN